MEIAVSLLAFSALVVSWLVLPSARRAKPTPTRLPAVLHRAA